MAGSTSLFIDGSIPPARVGGVLRDVRGRARVTRREVAEAAGVSPRKIAQYERGRAPVPADVLARLDSYYLGAISRALPERVPVRVASGQVVAGDATRTVDDGDEQALLRAYIDLLARLRHAAPGESLALRDTDLRTLAVILGRETEAVETQIVELLGCTREEASRLHAALLHRKLLVPIAGLALGAVVFTGAKSASADDAGTSPLSGHDADAVLLVEDSVNAAWQVPLAATVEEVPVEDATPEAPATQPPAVVEAPAPEPAADVPAPDFDPAPDTDPAPVADTPPADDPLVSIPEGEIFVEIGDSVTDS